jgi:hypothetical protein
MNKNLLNIIPATALLALSLTACSDSDEPNKGNGNTDTDTTASAFIFATSVQDGDKTANVLLSGSDLDGSVISPINNGLVNDGATEWVYFNNKYLYALTYNQQNAGTTRSYVLDSDNQMVARSAEYKVSRFSSYGTFGKYIITASTGSGLSEYADAEGNLPKMFLLSYLDVEGETCISSDSKANKDNLMSENFLGTGEYVTLSGFLEANSKLYSAVIPMGLSPYGTGIDGGKYILAGNEDLVKTESGGTNSGAYVKGELQGTQYPNQCSVAIFDDEQLNGKRIITTDKISYACGRYKSQYYQTIRQADNGDIYVFSPSFAKTLTDARQQTTLDAGVVRIKKGATEFDANYYYNIEKLSNGRTFQRCLNAGGSCFLLTMYSTALTSNQQVANQLAIFNGETGKFTYVTGLPAQDTISDFSKTVYAANGYCYIAVMTSTGYPTIYKIDTATGVATAGTQLQVATVTALGVLNQL